MYLFDCDLELIQVLDVYIYFTFNISLMAGTTWEINAKLSRLGEAESSWQQSGSHKKQRSGNLRPVLPSIIKGGLDMKTSGVWHVPLFSTCFYQMLDQGVKYLEDMQDDFDFRYKTLQLRGEPP